MLMPTPLPLGLVVKKGTNMLSISPALMPQPLSMVEATGRAEHWWQAQEVMRVFPDGQAVTDFLGWLSRYQLGRKRLLVTLLAATFQQASVKKLITNNERDYRNFGRFEIVTFQPS